MSGISSFDGTYNFFCVTLCYSLLQVGHKYSMLPKSTSLLSVCEHDKSRGIENVSAYLCVCKFSVFM